MIENGVYKITDIQFITGDTNYKRCLEGHSDLCCLSPALLQALMHRDLHPVHTIEKSDVFALGVTALQMANLQSVADIYDFDQFQVKSEILALKLRQVKLTYSESL